MKIIKLMKLFTNRKIKNVEKNRYVIEERTLFMFPRYVDLVNKCFRWKKGQSFYQHCTGSFGRCKKILKEIENDEN